MGYAMRVILFLFMLVVRVEAVDSNLLVWLTFEEDFPSATYIKDWSGNGNHAQRFGKPTDPGKTNFPTRIAVTNTPGLLTSGYCGQFAIFTNTTYSFYDREGQYAAFTNSTLTNLNAATFAVWARYYAAANSNYQSVHIQQFLSTGVASAKPGTWAFGRSSSPDTRFIVLTNTVGGSALEYPFPDSNVNDGNTTNWHHYAVTWSNGVFLLYFDGTNCHNGNVSGTTTNLILGQNFAEAKWIGVGVHTHGGDYWLDDAVDDYPNHGWFTGVMDDVRIYNRALSAGEVLAVYQTFGASASESGPQSVAIGSGVTVGPGVTIR